MTTFRQNARPAAAFLALAALLYLCLFAFAEWHLRKTETHNPMLRITAMSAPSQDWIVLGASHALPLGFRDMEPLIEARTARSLMNLAVTGAGPFVMRLVAERYFHDHRAAGVLIVADGFGFADRRWNEGRMDDSDMLPRVPLDGATFAVFAQAMPRFDPQSLVDYANGFSKINAVAGLFADTWSGEERFDESRKKPSATADAERVAFLYPADAVLQDRYFDDLAATVALARSAGARVVILRPPLPAAFAARLPFEAEVAARLSDLAQAGGAEMADFAAALPEQRFYFDSDHLNRQGVEAWLDLGLAALLSGAAPD